MPGIEIDKRIEKNYIFAQILRLFVRFEKNYENKIRLVENIAGYYFIRETGRYSDELLEKEIIKISKTIKFNSHNKEVPDTTLHVLSHAEFSGGHNRLVKNWIEFDESRKHSIVITKQYKNPIPDFLIESVEKTGGRIYNLVNDNRMKKARQLLDIASRYEKIIIHSHPDDVTPLLAFANPNWIKPIYVLNQANYAFNIWVSIADMVLDLSKNDQQLSLRYRGCNQSEILPIPINEQKITKTHIKERDNKSIYDKYMLPNNCKIITSMAADFKYTPVADYNFQEMVKTVVSSYNNVYFLIIGGDKRKDKWKRLIKETNDKVKVLGVLPKDKVDEIFEITDLYIDSIPISSFSCVLQAIDNDIPTASLFVRGLVPDSLNIISKQSTAEMIDWIKESLNGVSKREIEANKMTINNYHKKETWCDNLERIYRIPLKHRLYTFHSRLRNDDYEKIFCVAFQQNYQYELSNVLSYPKKFFLSWLIKILKVNEKI
jgi:hypothetical protein